MSFTTSRRAMVSALVAVAAVPAARLVGAQDASTPTDHEAHHAGTPTVTPGTGMMGTPGAGLMATHEFDLLFIDMMTPHHEGAIAMAEVALERAEHPELGELAQQIIDSQQAEIDQMQAWRDEWYPDAPVTSIDGMMGDMGTMMEGMPGMHDMTGMMTTGMMGMMDPETMADEMRTAAEPFDLAFINAMLPHHMMALMMAEMAVQQAAHAELADLARGMVGEQAGEIGQMNDWRSEWYGTGVITASPQSGGTVPSGARRITIQAEGNQYTTTDGADQFTVAQGEMVEFEVINRDGYMHDFAARGNTPVRFEAVPLDAGETAYATYTVDVDPGTYAFICTIHPGMAIDMIVE